MRRGGLLLLAPLMAVAACGSSSSSTASGGGGGNAAAGATTDAASSAAAVNVCTLLTKDQVTAAMGRPVSDGKAGSGGMPACTWGTVDTARYGYVTLSFDASPASFDAAKKLNGQSGVTIRPVSNLGQDALYFGSGDGAILEVKTSRGVLSVGLRQRSDNPDFAQQDSAEKTLAMQALTHL